MITFFIEYWKYRIFPNFFWGRPQKRKNQKKDKIKRERERERERSALTGSTQVEVGVEDTKREREKRRQRERAWSSTLRDIVVTLVFRTRIRPPLVTFWRVQT